MSHSMQPPRGTVLHRLVIPSSLALLLLIGCNSQPAASSSARDAGSAGGTSNARPAGTSSGPSSATPGGTSGPTPSASASASVADAGQVLAVVDGDEVTLADLQEMIGNQLSRMDYGYFSQRHQVIEQATHAYVRQRLLEAEAQDRGVTIEELTAEVLAGKVDVSDDDVRNFYIQNQAQLQGRPFNTIAPQIRDYLEGQLRDSVLEEFATGIAETREVDYRLQPFRVDIDTADAPVAGPADAPITLVEFSDFQCPYCKQFAPTLDQVKATYADEVKIVFMQFPLRDLHPNAQKAAEAALCANEQGKFWEAHDLYFSEQDSLDPAGLVEKAARLGLDTGTFNACFEGEKYVDRIDAEVSVATSLGLTGTPALFINGRPLPGGAVPFEMVAELIDDELDRAGR